MDPTTLLPEGYKCPVCDLARPFADADLFPTLRWGITNGMAYCMLCQTPHCCVDGVMECALRSEWIPVYRRLWQQTKTPLDAHKAEKFVKEHPSEFARLYRKLR